MSVLDLGADVVYVVPPTVPTVVAAPPTSSSAPVVLVSGPAGPRGPAGSGTTYQFATPASTWTITHNLGRLPALTIYVGTAVAETDVVSDFTTATLTWATPVSGSVVVV